VYRGAQAAQAQTASTATAPQESLEEVIVTGYRESLETALNNKRNSNLPIESVAPEDIGKMPDQNVAESLQRLPGIQIDRAGGQGTAVLIDGLRQNLTTLNGDLFLTARNSTFRAKARAAAPAVTASTTPSKASQARISAASTSTRIRTPR